MSAFCRDIFAGKVACVTGGATGIGFAIASELNYLGIFSIFNVRTSYKFIYK